MHKEGELSKILMAPLDPVHDVGLRMIGGGLGERGYQVITLPPGCEVEEVVDEVQKERPFVLLIGRTIGYGVAEIMARLVDLLEASGLRKGLKLGLGGMAITPQLAHELGFDAGFGPGTQLHQVVAFVEGKKVQTDSTLQGDLKEKPSITSGYSYQFLDSVISNLLEEIIHHLFQWAQDKTSPGLVRAHLREQMFLDQEESFLRREYASLCDEDIKDFYLEGVLPEGVYSIDSTQIQLMEKKLKKIPLPNTSKVQHLHHQPLIFVQYGTGCPLMDIIHIKTSERWGADGVLHFDPSWSANTEGLLEGHLSQQDTGTLYTPESLKLINAYLDPSTLWCIRAHRGLNTPEIVVLAGQLGADLVKINPTYGSLAGGTDPERLMVDSIAAIRYAAKYKLPFDIPVGQELAGVPSAIAFAGMLIIASLGIRLKARPILNPLFCYSPHVMLEGKMEKNYVDFNAARIGALRSILNAPIRAGEPVAFMTHTEERVQSAMTTALHTGLAMSLGVDSITIASTDEAYSGGPITIVSRIDTLKAVKETFRFFGESTISPTPRALEWKEELLEDIKGVLERVLLEKDPVTAIYQGILGGKEEGVYPGRAGRGTVNVKGVEKGSCSFKDG